jgi:hypothetical protein
MTNLLKKVKNSIDFRSPHLGSLLHPRTVMSEGYTYIPLMLNY